MLAMFFASQLHTAFQEALARLSTITMQGWQRGDELMFEGGENESWPQLNTEPIFHINHNLQVWMDEWKDFYFSFNPGARKAEKGDVSK